MPPRKIKGIWHMDSWVNIPGQGRIRIRKKSPSNTKAATELYERQVIEELLRGDSSISKRSGTEERRFGDYAVEFLENYAVARNKYSEVESKESILRVHLIPAFGSFKLSEITTKAIDAYIAAKIVEKVGPKTINNTLTVLRRSLAVAVEWDYLRSVPLVRWARAPKPDFDFLNFEEADRLVAGSDPDWRVMLKTAMKTGLRQGELIALRWQDVDLVAGRLRVCQAAARGKVGTPKSNRSREVALPVSLVTELKRYRHLKSELVFCQPDGRMYTKNECKHPLWRACKRAGLRQIGWHVLRHTYASHLVMRGVPLKAVQELLGHATIEMTMRYAHLSPEMKGQAVEVLDLPSVGRYLGSGSQKNGLSS